MINIYVFDEDFKSSIYPKLIFDKLSKKYKEDKFVSVKKRIEGKGFIAKNYINNMNMLARDVVIHIYPIVWFNPPSIYYRYLNEVFLENPINFRENKLLTIGVAPEGEKAYLAGGKYGHNLNFFNAPVLTFQEILGFELLEPLWLFDAKPKIKNVEKKASQLVEEIIKRIEENL